MTTLDKIVNPGSGRHGHVYCRIQYDGKRLSITGVVGPMANGNARGGCGQIDEHLAEDVTTFAPGWDAAELARFADTWRAWHLNDMRAGCEHQRTWDVGAVLELRRLTWGPAYHRLRERAQDGTMGADEWATWGETVRIVERLTMGVYPPKHPDCWGEDGARALSRQLVKEEAVKVERAGWVYPQEHPGGLLMKPCPACGYKYGSAWLMETVPDAVLSYLAGLPDTARQPAWV